MSHLDKTRPMSQRNQKKKGEEIWVTAFVENVYERSNTLQVLNANDETGRDIYDELSEWSVPGTHFDRQPHTHRMVIGQTTQTKQFPEFLEDSF